MLKKVIILNQTPRYDDKSVDPLSLKPALALLFNNTLSLWIESPLKAKLTIGIHNLDCSGGVKEARYRDIKNKKYDGLHMYGPSGRKAYTVSMLNILKSADIFELKNGQTALDYYKDLLKFQFQKKKSPIHHRAKTQPDSANDRDVRKNMNNRAHEQKYSVPTANMLEYLNC